MGTSDVFQVLKIARAEKTLKKKNATVTLLWTRNSELASKLLTCFIWANQLQPFDRWTKHEFSGKLYELNNFLYQEHEKSVKRCQVCNCSVMSYLEQTVDGDLNFGWTALSLNDVKRDLTVVEIVLAYWICSILVGKYHTENPWKLFDVVVCGVLLMCDMR